MFSACDASRFWGLEAPQTLLLRQALVICRRANARAYCPVFIVSIDAVTREHLVNIVLRCLDVALAPENALTELRGDGVC